MKQLIKRYRVVLLMIVVLVCMYIYNNKLGMKATLNSLQSIKQMLMLIPPIFVLLGLLDVWVPRETMMKLMGDESGIKGIILAFLMGSLTAGPLYGAFPVAAVLMKKGVKFSNILIFIGAWSTTKLPMILFEATNLGWNFALLRLAIDIPGILLIAYILSHLVSFDERKKIYHDAQHVHDELS